MTSLVTTSNNLLNDHENVRSSQRHSSLTHEDDLVDYDDSDGDHDQLEPAEKGVFTDSVNGGGVEQQRKVGASEAKHDRNAEGEEKDAMGGGKSKSLPGKEDQKEEAYYIPPALRALRATMSHGRESDEQRRQRTSWDQLKANIQGTVNRWNTTNVRDCVLFLFQNANLLRGRGLLARSILTQAAAASTVDDKLTQVSAAVVAVINSKLPEVGEVILARTLSSLRDQYYKNRQRRYSTLTMGHIVFIGHLVNQAVAHEIVALQLLALLLQDDNHNSNIETAIDLLKVCAYKLQETSPNGLRAVLERFRHILHQGLVSDKLQYAIEDLLVCAASSKDVFFVKHPIPELDLVEEEDQITHDIGLDDDADNATLELVRQDAIDTYRFDEEYEENEQTWNKIRAEILGDDEDDETNEGESANSAESDAEKEEEKAAAMLDPEKAQKKQDFIQDLSEQDLIHLRRTIYLTIMSSASYEECAHKLASVKIPQGRENELVNMLIECCSQERTFIRYYGLIGQRFCLLRDSRWAPAFITAFQEQYTTIHRLETNKLRNVAKLFAHLFHTDAIPWSALEIIHMNEDETTSSSRIFVKILIQEMAEALGIEALKRRFFTNEDPFQGMFPKDNPRNTRYAINFFTSIGLGALTERLREHLKNAPMLLLAQARAEAEAAAAAKHSSSDSESSSVSSSSSSSSSSYGRRRRRRQGDTSRKIDKKTSYRKSSSSYSSYTTTSSSSSESRSSSSSDSSSYTSTSSSSASPRPKRSHNNRSRSSREERKRRSSRRGSSTSSSSDSRLPSPQPKRKHNSQRGNSIVRRRGSTRDSSPSSSSDRESRNRSKRRITNRRKRNDSCSSSSYRGKECDHRSEKEKNNPSHNNKLSSRSGREETRNRDEIPRTKRSSSSMSESRSSSLSRQEPPNDKANKFPKDGQKSVNDTQDQVQLSTTAQNEQSLRSHEAGKRKRTEESLGDKSTLNEKEEEKRMKM
jgi:pre-mRNA-splicing factor CWC22